MKYEKEPKKLNPGEAETTQAGTNLKRSEQRSPIDYFAQKRASMEAIAQTSLLAAKTHPDQFEATLTQSEAGIDLTICSTFEFDNTRFRLRISLDHRTDRSIKQVSFVEEGKSYYQPNVISYRLDISTGKEVEREHSIEVSRAKELDPTDAETQKLRSGVLDMLLATYVSTGDERVVSCVDTYADTTVKTSEALAIIQGASNFKLPNERDFGTIITLKDFMEWINENQNTVSKSIKGLLG